MNTNLQDDSLELTDFLYSYIQASDDWYILTKATPREQRGLLRERIKELNAQLKKPKEEL